MIEQENIGLAAVTEAAGAGAANLHPEAGARRRHARTRLVTPTAAGFIQPLPGWVWIAAGTATVWGFFTSNPFLTPVCVLTLPVLASLLWFRGEPPILLASCAMQWLQVTTAVFYCNSYRASLETAFGVPEMERATLLSLAGLLVLALGMRLALKYQPGAAAPEAERDVRGLSVQRMFTAWLVSFVFASGVSVVAWMIPGLSQLIYAMVSFKWVFFFIFAYSVLVRDDGHGLLVIAVLVEFTTGLLQYFSGFKEVFFMLVVVGMSVRSRLSPSSRTLLGTCLVATVGVSLIWTAVKMDYRGFLNKGSGQQTVSVPVMARFQKLGELVAALDGKKISESVDALIFRVAYTEYFAHTLIHVPENVPYAKGELWLGAISHVVKPRLLFPNKAALSDSRRTEMYTGIAVAGTEEGTSIGIGYMAESYIDFGPKLMYLPIFLLGLFFGFIYRYFAFNSRSQILGFGIATGVLFGTLQAFATSNVKIFGGTVTGFLIMFAFNRVFGGMVLGWLRSPQRAARRGGRPGPRPAPPGESPAPR